MAETLQNKYIASNGTTAVKVLDGEGSDIVYTILSITICNTRSGDDETFDLYVKDVDSGNDFYIYMTQSLPALATFEHTSKLIIKDDEELTFVLDDNTNGTDVDIIISYLKQT